MSNNIVVSASPHIKDRKDTKKVMWIVIASLVPTIVASSIIFGFRALLVICISIITCVVTEVVCELIFKKEITIKDGSAVITGILLAFTLPPATPWWMVIIGGVAAIFMVKQLFGGLGYNIFNPALAARAILLASFPVQMTSWTKPVASFFQTDAVTQASFLGGLKEGVAGAEKAYSLAELFFGMVPGSLGETCKLTLLIGAAFLLLVRIIDFRIPLPYIGIVMIVSWIFGRNPVDALFSGGLILGAFFMATDMVTSPVSGWGKILFGTGCGILTVLIRKFGGFPEGVCYSILLMNCFTPVMDKYIRPRLFGTKLFAGKKNPVQ
jgi:electron transport complex protein RnfD